MRVTLSETIRTFRKERRMTQEQLAEMMGVSVSAVYKWESGQSTPEVRLILEMADLFNTSTDVLLGYTWRNNNAATALDRISALIKEQAYDEAMAEAEKALKRYPNHFDIVYQSALLYLALGEDAEHRQLNHRAIELLSHACELIAQNRDDTVSEVSIRTQMAKAHLMLNNTGAALRILKKHNVCGVNNALIGMVLGDYLHDADQAETYLGKAFAAFAEDINAIMVGYANVFFQRKNFDAAVDCFRWLRTVLRGIQPETELTWFDKYDCVILETIAECYCFKGDFDSARHYLKEAVTKAVRYDLAAPGDVSDMAFFTTLHLENQPNYDYYGKTARDCLTRRIPLTDDGIPRLRELWLDVQKDVLTDETV